MDCYIISPTAVSSEQAAACHTNKKAGGIGEGQRMVVYWSGTGNTEVMTQAVGQGIKLAGAEIVGETGVICNLTPDSDGEAQCVALALVYELLKTKSGKPLFMRIPRLL